MSEADMMTTTGAAARLPARPHHLEPVVTEMVGAAAIAAKVLEMIRTEPNGCSELLLNEGLAWLEARLSNAAENLHAVQIQRPPRWFTTMEADMIREALDAIPERDAPQENDNTPWLLTGAEPAALLRAQTPEEIEVLAVMRRLRVDQQDAALTLLRQAAGIPTPQGAAAQGGA